jgi:hypothetical protein
VIFDYRFSDSAEPQRMSGAAWASIKLLGAIGFAIMPVSCFVFWRRFREDHLWRKFAGWTRGVIIVAAIVLMKLCQLEPNPVSPWSGCFSECYSSPILDGYLRLRWCFTEEVKSRKLISNLTNYKSHDYSSSYSTSCLWSTGTLFRLAEQRIS